MSKIRSSRNPIEEEFLFFFQTKRVESVPMSNVECRIDGVIKVWTEEYS